MPVKQISSKVQTLAELYDTYVEMPPTDASISKEYVWFEMLTYKDIAPLQLSPFVHDRLLHISDISSVDQAAEYLGYLNSLIECESDNVTSLKLYFMMNVIMLHILLCNISRMNLFYKLYALCLACFDYTLMTERI